MNSYVKSIYLRPFLAFGGDSVWIRLHRLAPITFAVPAVLGYLSLLSQSHGLGTQFSVLLVVFSFVITAFAVVANAMSLRLTQQECAIAETARDIAETRYRRLVDSNFIGVMELDGKGQIVEANEAFLSLLGYTRGEMEASGLRWDNFACKPGDPSQRNFRRIEERGMCIPWESEFVRRDGRRVPVLVGLVQLIPVDRKICFALDLTERKHAEEVKRLNAELEHRVLDNAAFIREQSAQIERYIAAAHTDPLTLLPNRRAFEQELTRRLAEWRRRGVPLSLLMIDADCFKQLNDTFGHATGDDVLRQLARLLGSAVRDTDLLSRYGGEEFAAVLPAATIRDAVRVAERMRNSVAAHPLDIGGVSPRVTVSIGVAEAAEADDDGSLVRRADAALYAAKRAGRNRTFLHEPALNEPVPASSKLSGAIPTPRMLLSANSNAAVC